MPLDPFSAFVLFTSAAATVSSAVSSRAAARRQREAARKLERQSRAKQQFERRHRASLNRRSVLPSLGLGNSRNKLAQPNNLGNAKSG